ncbi:MAG: hypothetical protein M1820_007510 [Bogoriella megaspora]|nr:MAG: hypothetical protein M1820_007510 [Bogoriella megaspora]
MDFQHSFGGQKAAAVHESSMENTFHTPLSSPDVDGLERVGSQWNPHGRTPENPSSQQSQNADLGGSSQEIYSPIVSPSLQRLFASAGTPLSSTQSQQNSSPTIVATPRFRHFSKPLPPIPQDEAEEEADNGSHSRDWNMLQDYHQIQKGFRGDQYQQSNLSRRSSSLHVPETFYAQGRNPEISDFGSLLYPSPIYFLGRDGDSPSKRDTIERIEELRRSGSFPQDVPEPLQIWRSRAGAEKPNLKRGNSIISRASKHLSSISITPADAIYPNTTTETYGTEPYSQIPDLPTHLEHLPSSQTFPSGLNVRFESPIARSLIKDRPGTRTQSPITGPTLRSTRSRIPDNTAPWPSPLPPPLSPPPLLPITDPNEPPDGGYLAYLQALALALVIFNCWGLSYLFFLQAPYYHRHQLKHTPYSSISVIGSIQLFFLFILSPLTGLLTDRGYFRPVFHLGSLVLLAGTFGMASVHTFGMLVFVQGFVMGVGMGMVFMPGVVVVGQYFRKKLGIAAAMGACGSGVGGLVYVSALESLVDKEGLKWGWAIVSFGFVVLGMKDRECVDVLLTMIACNLFGRFIPAIISDRYTGPLNTLIPSCILSAIVIFLWATVGHPASLFVAAGFYGFVSAGIQSLFAVVAYGFSVGDDLLTMGFRNGVVFVFIAFACLSGTPIAGALINLEAGGDLKRGYVYASIFAGLSWLMAAVCFTVSRVKRKGWRRARC